MTSRPGDSRPAWLPDFLDLDGLAYTLSTSKKSVQRMLASGKLPPADVNVSGAGSAKGRRWRRERVLAWLAGRPYQ